jgi:ADP-heptose:LPS heptosyltransferase
MTNTLIYRGIPGLGDALSCTPAIQEYVKDHPEEKVWLSFPRWILPVLYGFCDDNHIPSEDVDITKASFDKIIKLSDPCPAATYEFAHLQKTAKSRIQIFAGAMGYSPLQFLGKRPIWNWMADEEQDRRILRNKFVGGKIGIAPFTSDKYRDYPHTKELIKELADIKNVKHIFVFVKNTSDITLENYENKIQVIGDISIRKSVVYQSICDYFITPDTFFLHSAAAINIGTMLLEGPLANDVRFYGYPVIRLNAKLDCIPCWRNTYTPCRLDPEHLENSVCMQKMTPQFIKRTIVEGMLK